MIEAVPDTNILASGLVAVSGPIAILTDAWRGGAFRVIVSEVLLRELESALAKPYFTRRLAPDVIDGYLALVSS